MIEQTKKLWNLLKAFNKYPNGVLQILCNLGANSQIDNKYRKFSLTFDILIVILEHKKESKRGIVSKKNYQILESKEKN